ncbi:MAG TPA: metallophosphoesterase [Roseiflexaceae bacterium]|nr:metallophosphoesterase [Roseiflexaceae bacterium]
MTRLFFATDIHGSEICWRKFLNAGAFYGADVLVLGGDMTGKALVPLVSLPGGRFKATLLQQEFVLGSEDEVRDMERRIASRGYYPFRTTPEQLALLEASPAQVDALFHEQMLRTMERWVALADERLAGTRIRCYVAPGNDDPPAIDAVIQGATYVQLAEGRAVELGDGFTMVSTGWSNVTPWRTYRELPEEQLAAKIAAMIPPGLDMRRTVFNFHCPPYGSHLDEAPEVDAELNVKNAGHTLVPVGSTAVRDAIVRHQPLLSLHGHIHEGKGAARIGRTLAINAGSLYEQGVLQGALVELDPTKGIRSYTLTTG